MAGKTIINGTARDIIGGKVLINGVSRDISGGKTNINGTLYDIPFGPVPPAYRQVDYIISKGIDSITVPIPYQQDLKVETIAYTRAPSPASEPDIYFCGIINANAHFTFLVKNDLLSNDDRIFVTTFKYSNRNNAIEVNGGFHPIDGSSSTSQDVYKACKQKFILNTGYPGSSSASLNGQTGSVNSSTTYDNSNLILFKRTATLYTEGGFGQISAYVNNNLIADLYPCQRRSDNRLGYYDSIGNQFYTYEGSNHNAFSIGTLPT